MSMSSTAARPIWIFADSALIPLAESILSFLVSDNGSVEFFRSLFGISLLFFSAIEVSLLIAVQ